MKAAGALDLAACYSVLEELKGTRGEGLGDPPSATEKGLARIQDLYSARYGRRTGRSSQRSPRTPSLASLPGSRRVEETVRRLLGQKEPTE